MTPSEHDQTGADAATELLFRRSQLQEWLSRLEQVDEDIPAQVARRVRMDYEQRLAAVVGELSTHSEALAADRERLDEKLLAAAERHDSAVDALEETRLRHRIGELSEGDWESRRPGLESEVEAAAAEREATQREISALEELLGQIGEPPAAGETVSDAGAAPTAPAEPAEAPIARAADFAAAAEEWAPELPLIEESAAPVVAESQRPAEPTPEAQPNGDPASDEIRAEEPLEVSAYASEEASPAPDDLVEITNFAAAAEALADEVDSAAKDDDYAFLEELDRAIAATAPTAGSEEEPTEDTRPQPGLKCPDCGYSNDPAAWYCGVCGVDLS